LAEGERLQRAGQCDLRGEDGFSVRLGSVVYGVTHLIQTIQDSGAWVATCTCGWTSSRKRLLAQAEAVGLLHAEANS
jgi:hypothetical protein